MDDTQRIMLMEKIKKYGSRQIKNGANYLVAGRLI